jgi:ubiquinone/menaquinone biosynthesis C-methylase UbiE
VRRVTPARTFGGRPRGLTSDAGHRPAPESSTDSPLAPEQVTVGRHHAHDTQTPDIETASERYAARFSGELGAWLLQQQSAAVARVLDTLPNRPLRILDVGGGHGQLAPLLLQRGHTVVVQGSAPDCFARLQPLADRHPDRLTLTTSSLWHLPFDDAHFDLVVAVRLFGHVRRWQALLSEMARVSRSYMLVEFARAGSSVLQPVGDALFALKHSIEGTTRPFFAYRERTILQELAKSGFEPSATAAQFALPMVLHRSLGRPLLSERLESALRRLGLGDRGRSPVIVLARRTVRPVPR